MTDEETELVLGVAVRAGNASDADGTLPLLAAAQEIDSVDVGTLLGDMAYSDPELREATEEAGVDLVAKVPPVTNAGRFPKTDFAIDTKAGTVTCPAGVTTTDAKAEKDHKGRPGRRFSFPLRTCAACPARGRCVKADKAGRIDEPTTSGYVFSERHAQTTAGHLHIATRTVRDQRPGGTSVLPSDSDDLHEGPQASEIVRVARVERQSVRMGRRGDEQVSDTAPVGATGLDDGGDDLAVAASSGNVEGNRFEGRLELLESSLSARTFGGCRGEMWTGGQLGKGDRTDRRLLGERGSDIGVVPVDDHGRVQQSGGHLQALVDDAIEVGSELREVDVRSRGRERHEVGLRHEAPTRPSDRAELGHRDAIAGDDERLPGGNRVDHLCVVVAQFALGNGLGHA